MLYTLARQALFQLETEMSHHITLDLISAAERLRVLPHLIPEPELPVELMGLSFKSPVGLAAGMDKNGDYIDGLASLGFGFIEVGTVTPRPQPGNPRPRLFRLPQHQAIINRMGFNNKGIDYMCERIEASRYSGILGINIGKNFDTPVENALDDYLICMKKAYRLASYIVVNISSPNTPGLRSLQHGESLKRLLDGLKNEQQRQAGQCMRQVPLVVKIAPDLDEAALDEIAEALVSCGMEGVIATNTTMTRPGLEGHPLAGEAGGLSGAPVYDLSNRVLGGLAARLEGKIPIIGVGGIMKPEDALHKMALGASLVQLYTGFIYEGPALIWKIVQALQKQNPLPE
ncbi:Dihydroorotate dehydrogenase [gamma proteobacterium HdN1]|nr:Dihydroorotate dehydrogenase [gamma proteobacterium HdN1]